MESSTANRPHPEVAAGSVLASLLSSTAMPAEEIVGFQLVSSKTVDLTPEFVHEFRTLPPSPTDRARSERRIKHLRDKANRGLLTSFFWVIGVLPDGTRFRLNGQHSSEMLEGMIADGKFPPDLKVHVDEYSIADLEAAARLFRQFDDRASGRTPGDVAGVYQAFHPQLAGVAPGIAKVGVEAITWYRNYIEGLPVSLFSDEEIYPFLLWLGQIFAERGANREMFKIHVMAAMYGCFIANETEARTFWAEVADGGADFNEAAPSTLLSSWLQVQNGPDRDRDVKPKHAYQASVFCWNAQRENRTISTVRYEAKKSYYKISH
jgi:hypothetical protein